MGEGGRRAWEWGMEMGMGREKRSGVEVCEAIGLAKQWLRERWRSVASQESGCR